MGYNVSMMADSTSRWAEALREISGRVQNPEKASRDEATEKEILDKIKASMTQEDLAELARATHELKFKQETPDPPEALYVYQVFLCKVGNINGVKVLQHDPFTNDVFYVELFST